jgi:hypothetical protein
MFVTKALPFCHERFAASASKTGKTSAISSDMAICFRGLGYASEFAEVANLSDNVSLES